MAAFTHRGVTWTTTAGNKTVVATPAVGDLIIVACAVATLTTVPAITDNNSSGTYQRITSGLKNSSADVMAIFVRNSLILAASSTTFTMTSAGDAGGGLEVMSLSGMTRVGQHAVRGFGQQQNQAGATIPAPVLPRAALTDSAMYGFINDSTNGSANGVVPSGWAAEDVDQGHNVPANGIHVCHRNLGEVGTTITYGGTTPSAWGCIVIELDTRGWDWVDPMLGCSPLMGTGLKSGSGM